jgi:carbon monoxide dehydrogenase subunit G
VGTHREEILTEAPPAAVWDALRDVGALHTRLVPGFVVDTKLEPGARIVTFGNGMVIREPIVGIDEETRRVVWTAEGGQMAHYNGAAQVFARPDGTSRVVWTADFLPDEAAAFVGEMMAQGAAAMKAALDRLA